MKRTWLWVEDESDSVPDNVLSMLEKRGVLHFPSLDKLLEYLEPIAQRGNSEPAVFGFILDVCIEGSPAIYRPSSLSADGQEAIIYTDSGFDAGLIFYDEVILADTKEKSIFHPPPPVIFLTVRHTDSQVILSHLDKIKKAWAQGHGCAARDVHVKWVRKSKVAEDDIARCLEEW